MAVELTKDERRLIEDIAEKNGFSVFDVVANKGTEKGDNFMGVLTSVTVKSGDKQLRLYLKAAHTVQAVRDVMQARTVFEREIGIYVIVFQYFTAFQKDHNILDLFDAFPKFYGSSLKEGNEIFVMEDLKAQGYELWEKKLPMNDEHIRAVLREYGKFHATSIAMNQKCPEVFKEITKNHRYSIWEKADKTDGNQEKFMDNLIKGIDKVIENREDLKEYVRGFNYKKLFENVDPKYKIVICHGDSWCNNFMFNYKDDKTKTKPTNMKIVDWQIAHVTSPAYDFVYFFVVESPKEILNDYRTYMKLYHDTLSKQLKNYGLDPEEVFPYSSFEEHIKRFMPMAIIIATMLLKIMICESSEAPDFTDVEESKDFFKKLEFESTNVEEYNRRLLDVIVFLKDNDFYMN